MRLLTNVRGTGTAGLFGLVALLMVARTASAHSDEMEVVGAAGLPGWLAPHAETLGMLHVAAHVLLGVFSIAIFAALAYVYARSRSALSYHPPLLAFGLFIIAAGLYNFAHAGLELGMPIMMVSGTVQAVTLAAAGVTVFTLPRLVPGLLGTVKAATLSERRQAALRASQTELEALRARRDRREARAGATLQHGAEEVRVALPLSAALHQAAGSRARPVAEDPTPSHATGVSRLEA